MLTKDEILAANDRPMTTLAVPEWGGEVCLRQLTAEEAQQYRIFSLDDNWKVDRAKALKNHLVLASLTLCDEAGARIFTADELTGKSAAAIERVAAEARKLNGLDTDSVDLAEKN
jgi:hypothetical protein